MRRILAVCAALVVVFTATPAWAVSLTLTVDGVPSKIYYNTPFTITINYKNTTGATVDNPHPLVFLYPTPNVPPNHCNPAFRDTMAELSVPYATPISEHETTPGSTNCIVWWGFDLTHHWSMPNNTNSNWPSVKITARYPSGVTALNLKVVVANPSAPDEPYATKSYLIPVATLPPPPSPITPTTHAPTPSPTAVATESPSAEPSLSDSPIPASTSDEAGTPITKPAASQGLSSVWVVAGIGLITIGGVLLVLLLRWRRPESEDL